MAWFLRFILLAIVAAGCISGWMAGGMVTPDMKLSASSDPFDDVKPIKGAGGAPLIADVQSSLSRINAQRDARKDGSTSRTVYLEKVSFERSAGGVVARGSVADWAAPRTLKIVIDAFDAGKNYMASGSSSLSTTPGSSTFSVSLEDQDEFQSFSVRFLDEDMQEVVMRSAQTPVKKAPPLLIDDPLHSSDLSEVAERLVLLGYAEKAGPVRDEIVASALVARFRADYGLSGPQGVTVGDLLALREISGPAKKAADLIDY